MSNEVKKKEKSAGRTDRALDTQRWGLKNRVWELRGILVDLCPVWIRLENRRLAWSYTHTHTNTLIEGKIEMSKEAVCLSDRRAHFMFAAWHSLKIRGCWCVCVHLNSRPFLASTFSFLKLESVHFWVGPFFCHMSEADLNNNQHSWYVVVCSNV